MNDSGGLAKLVPGFDFLQNLAKSAGSAIPGLGGFGQWIAPTLDPAEIEKRIEELKTVQFWLEQNARMLATTIQALEVQRMTLATLKTMNVQLGEAKSMLTGGKAPFAPATTDAAPAAVARFADAMPKPKARSAAKAAALPPPVVDPMQWWGALTNQFTELATRTLKDSATDAAKAVAGSMLRGSAEGAKATLRRAASLPGKVAGAAGAAGAAAVGAAGAALAPRKKAAKRRRPATTTKGRDPSLRSG